VNRDSFTVAYQNEYITKISIRQLDEANNVNYEIELQEAFPRSITLMDLNQSAQNQTHRVNVIFAYRYWKRTDIPRNNIQVQVVPKLSLQTLPVLNRQQQTPRPGSDLGRALGNTGFDDTAVDFRNSTFELLR